MGSIYLGIDYGRKHVGIAISDELKFVAQPWRTVSTAKHNDPVGSTFRQVEKIKLDYRVEKIIIGAPLGSGAQPTQMSIEATKFAQELSAKTGVECILWDETYTSQQAAKITKNKEKTHAWAAAIILQSYLDHAAGI